MVFPILNYLSNCVSKFVALMDWYFGCLSREENVRISWIGGFYCFIVLIFFPLGVCVYLLCNLLTHRGFVYYYKQTSTNVDLFTYTSLIVI